MIPFEGYRTFSINYVNLVQQIMYAWLNRSRDTSPNFHILQWNLYGHNVLKCKLTLFFRIGSLILTNTQYSSLHVRVLKRNEHCIKSSKTSFQQHSNCLLKNISIKYYSLCLCLREEMFAFLTSKGSKNNRWNKMYKIPFRFLF